MKTRVQRAEGIYNNGVRARKHVESIAKRLTILQEDVIIEYIIDLCNRKVTPRSDGTIKMANGLLRLRGGKPVDKNWVWLFVKNYYIESPTLLNKAIELSEDSNERALHQNILLQLRIEELEKSNKKC
ncbi:hypothetical protein K502DRAFT_364112 [Neoconidiobolus thromboides FSU 785]|nr:hypothetical protein K502DRAFT_364112 [Neoconidiobolus thromboides FSU 785]